MSIKVLPDIRALSVDTGKGMALHALHRLALCFCCRFRQTPEGRLCLIPAEAACSIPFASAQKLQVRLSDLPSRCVERRVSDVTPSNWLLPDFIPQLQPHLMLTGLAEAAVDSNARWLSARTCVLTWADRCNLFYCGLYTNASHMAGRIHTTAPSASLCLNCMAMPTPG